ncbi:MAG TPA: hypothetical protein EYO73_01895 [Sulfurimonas sp.]|nr:hypothetical protein [Sulfurimonas sp.]
MNISSVSSYTPSFLEPKEAKDTNEASLALKDDTQETGEGDETKSSDTITKDPTDLEPAERQQVAELQQRDSEVRAHEAAHIAAGGSAVSGSASYTYQQGPDGRLYAIGGEVAITASGGNSPQETISQARQIQAGALAPASPSPQDLKVASSAAMMEAQARQELALEKSEEQKEEEVNTYQDNQDEISLEENHTEILSLQA